MPPGAPWAVGAGGWGGSDVLLEIRGPRPREDPGVPLIDGLVRGTPAHAADGVAGFPPALRGFHPPGAVGRRAVPQELRQFSLLRVFLQETLYLGTKGGGDINSDSASPRWYDPTQHHKPPGGSSLTHAPQGMGGDEGHSHPRGLATTPGTGVGTKWGQPRSHAPWYLTACGAETAASSWHSGGQEPSPWAPRCSLGSSGVARTPTHPMACWEDEERVPGRSERHQEAMSSSGGGDGGGGGISRRAADGGQGSACTPCFLLAGDSRHQPWVQSAQAGSAKGLRAPRPRSGRVLAWSRTPTAPCPGSACPGAGVGSSPWQSRAGRAQRPPRWGPRGAVGLGQALGCWNWDGSTSCLQALAGGATFPRARRQQPQQDQTLLPTGTRVPNATTPPATAPLAGTSPNWGGTKGLGEPLTLQAHTLPPRSGP